MAPISGTGWPAKECWWNSCASVHHSRRRGRKSKHIVGSPPTRLKRVQRSGGGGLGGQGIPDDLAVDSASNVWCAPLWAAKVVCIDAEGAPTLWLALPTGLVTSLCIGGSELKTLYVTTGWNSEAKGAAKAKDLGAQSLSVSR
jgi:hypothetical protein